MATLDGLTHKGSRFTSACAVCWWHQIDTGWRIASKSIAKLLLSELVHGQRFSRSKQSP